MYKCPVCYHRCLRDDPRYSLETCSVCRTEFGIDDAGVEITSPQDLKRCHVELRRRWLLSQNACVVCAENSWHKDICASCTKRIPVRCKICESEIVGKCKQCDIQIRSELSDELNYLNQSVDNIELY